MPETSEPGVKGSRSRGRIATSKGTGLFALVNAVNWIADEAPSLAA